MPKLFKSAGDKYWIGKELYKGQSTSSSEPYINLPIKHFAKANWVAICHDAKKYLDIEIGRKATNETCFEIARMLSQVKLGKIYCLDHEADFGVRKLLYIQD